MAGQFEECNVRNTLVSESTFRIKEEHDFVENKVHISDTAISIGNTDFQVHVQYDHIKTELILSEIENEIEDQKIKTEEGFNADVIKMEFNNVLYCEECRVYYEDYCKECEMLERILNKNSWNNADNSTQELPDNILEIQNPFGQFRIYALKIIPAGVKFGPFTGLNRTECVRQIRGGKFIWENDKLKYLNWMQYINPAKNNSQQNLSVFQCQNHLYYQSTRQIQEGDELLVYFGEEYEDSLNTNEVDFIPTEQIIMKAVFACSFCCLGFNSKTYLAKHKTVCHAAVEFSIEELAQCPYCKIYLGQKEYIKHHKCYCERNESSNMSDQPGPSKPFTLLPKERQRLGHLTYDEKHTVLNIYKMLMIQTPKMGTTEIVINISRTLRLAKSTIYRIIKEYKETGELRPPKERVGRHSKLVEFDESIQNNIRQKVHSFVIKNEVPTLDKIMVEITADESIPKISRSTLHRFLKLINFKYAKQYQKKLVTEEDEIQVEKKISQNNKTVQR